MAEALKSIAIVGGGLHAWAAAARLSIALRGQKLRISVIDSAPKQLPGVLSLHTSVHDFHRALGIKEVDVLRNIGGAYKYGTRYQGFAPEQDDFYAYSPAGEMLNRIQFHHYLCRLKANGGDFSADQFSLSAAAAKENRFSHPEPNTVLANIDYALQVDRVRYQQFLQAFALDHGVQKISASVHATQLENGLISSLELSNSETLSADFYIDATGREAKLVEQGLKIGFEPISDLFVYDRRLHLSRQNNAATELFNTVSKTKHGWQCDVPIQGAIFTQFSFDSSHLSDDEAMAFIVSQSNSAVAPELNEFLTQKVGVRQQFWQTNCLAIGEAAGYVESILFTPFDLSLSAIERWLDLYPDASCNELLIEQYNLSTRNEYQRVIDVHAMGISTDVGNKLLPESLRHRISLFKSTGQVAFYESDVLSEKQWVNLLLCFGVWPNYHDPLINHMALADLEQLLCKKAEQVQAAVQRLPLHDQLLQAIRQSK